MAQRVELAELSEKKSELENQKTVAPAAVPVELMSGLGKLLKVVNNADESVKFTMRESEVEFKLARPVYVREVSLTLGSFDNVKGMKLIAFDVLSRKTEKISITVERVSGPSVRFVLNKVISSFVLKRESIFPKDIKKVVVTGIFLDELEKFETDYKELSGFKAELVSWVEEKETLLSDRAKELQSEEDRIQKLQVETEEKIERANDECASLTEKLEELNLAVVEGQADLEQKKQQQAQLLARNDDLEKRNLNAESELAQKLQKLTNANVSIANSERKLAELINNVNVFSEEFSGFVDQGTRQVKIYVGLALVPLSLLSIVVFYLFNGAVDLSTRFQSMAKIDLVTLLVTRLPFVTVAGLIVGVSVKVLFFLVNRIIAIHQQRLDLAKIAIIAKDVSEASSAGLDMSLEERYEAKTYLKMSILRAYLSDQIAKFAYVTRTGELFKRDELEGANELVNLEEKSGAEI